ncbi:hypothetical protein L1987_51796 [Smallanthus sonchifolius]|uniref:Uncharacterized protein n=1 Tax=Smallanthus sonchifolius TaxID=185202 RepID=A0ACB9ESG5_9ASTR|nr:hypothetical protein L1987_51796 [Smallanthus sonchifolius]
MDPNPSPRKMRILSYVRTRIPSFKRRQLQELENERLLRPSALPETYTELSQRESYTELAERVSHLTEDDILSNIRAVVVEVSQIRSVIKTLGEREIRKPWISLDILHDALMNGVERIDLSYRRLPFVPEAFEKLRTFVSLNLSANKLTALPDSLAGLQSLEELNDSTNLFESLPDAMGSL